jgi:hypothetical protein
MKQWIGVTALGFLAVLTVGCRDSASKRHVESAGGFSFVPPDGWTMRDFPGMKFKLAAGPAAAGFAPNINVVDEQFNGSLEDYVKGNLATLRASFKGFNLVQQDEFKTTAGEAGKRLITENEQKGRQLRQTFYFFGKGNTKFVVTCSALSDGGEKLDSAFETSMKTFRFDKD